MAILLPLIISLGSAISAAVGGVITRYRRRAKSQEQQADMSIVELHVMGDQESETVRLRLPAEEASRLLREARQASGSEPSA